MRLRHIFCSVVLAVVVVGCGDSRSRVVGIAHEVGVSKLRADLHALVASPAGQHHEIPQTAWPDSVRRFQPLSVQRHMTGMLIVLSRVDREQQGLLVMPDPKDDPGSGGSGVSYDRLGDSLFWCSEKIRVPFIPPGQKTNR
jgi:hypothetical protein